MVEIVDLNALNAEWHYGSQLVKVMVCNGPKETNWVTPII